MEQVLVRGHDEGWIVILVERTLADLPGTVDVLINNVGVSFQAADYFTVIARQNPALLSAMIHVNVNTGVSK